MKISIITINFNHGEGLLKTITSVVNQTFKNIEYIIIDGASSDNSIDKIKEFEDRISYWISEKDNGIYHAMNKGIKQSTGDYLLFLNSGDYLAKFDVIQNIVDKFKKKENSIEKNVIFYGNIIVNEKTILAPDQITLDVLSSSSLPHPSSFIAKEVFEKIGGYDEKYRIISDWIFFLDAYLKQVKFIYIEYPITVFELNGLSSNFIETENEKNKFLQKNYPNLIEDFKIFASFKTYKLSRIHQFIEYLRSILNSIFRKNK